MRADAVSAYGAVAGTTPHVDALAATGVRFTHAYAPAPWTIPSHVSLFTGLGVERHHVGTSERIVAGPELPMLAERLAAAGYDTAAFVENPLVSAAFGLQRGFAHFDARTVPQLLADFRQPGSSGFDVARAFADWAATRDGTRPFFAFVNLFDAHEPYVVRSENRFLPAGTTAEAARAVPQSPRRICDAVPSPDELAVLRGLYLGEVAAADAIFGEVQRRALAAAGPAGLLTVVTADHGEHLGERRLVDHQFTVDDVAVHVPLVVGGVRGATPAVVDAPVGLVDVTASLLAWAGVTLPTDALDGHPLPLAPESSPPARDLLVAYGDRQPADWPMTDIPAPGPDGKRSRCGPADRVFGDMAALVRYPHKLVWYARYPPQLFDLAVDPGEQHDLAAEQPALLHQLGATLAGRIERGGLFANGPDGAIDPQIHEALRALGYAE